MAKKSRPHDEGEAWAPAEAAHFDKDDESSSDEEDDPVQEDSGIWSMLDGDALVEAQLEAAQKEVDTMAARGAFNRCVDPVVPIVCFSDEGKGAFSEKSFADMLSGIIGSSKEVAMTVLADKQSKVVAYELSAPSSVADTIMRSTPAQRAGWRFWKRSEDLEDLSRLPQKIANLHGLEVIRIQKLPTGVAAWNLGPASLQNGSSNRGLTIGSSRHASNTSPVAPRSRAFQRQKLRAGVRRASNWCRSAREKSSATTRRRPSLHVSISWCVPQTQPSRALASLSSRWRQLCRSKSNRKLSK